MCKGARETERARVNWNASESSGEQAGPFSVSSELLCTQCYFLPRPIFIEQLDIVVNQSFQLFPSRCSHSSTKDRFCNF